MQRRWLLCRRCALLMIHIVAVVKPQTDSENDAHMDADYLCSNPGLWCNWTIQVQHGKRVQLNLEDLTPENICRLKMDQIHLDESPVAAGGAQILEKCWQKVRYTSISNTVHVVQLIGPNPNPPLRGFYGQYHAFGPPETPPTSIVGDTGSIKEDSQEEKHEVDTIDGVVEVPDQKSFTHEFTLPVEETDSTTAEPVYISPVTSSLTTELPVSGSLERNSGEIRKTRGGAENQASTAEGISGGLPTDEFRPRSLSDEMPGTLASFHAYPTHTAATPTGTTHILSTKGVEPVFTPSSTATDNSEAGLKSTSSPDETKPAATEMISSPGIKDSDDIAFVEMPLVDNGTTVQAGTVEPTEGFAQKKHQNSSRKPKLNHRIKGKSLSVQTFRSQAELPHLPGGLLLEVTVEVGVNHTHKESWDLLKNSFRTAVENMIQKDLGNLYLKSISSKRSKKLNAGVLLILWLQFGEGGDERLTLRDVQSTLQGLKRKTIHSHDLKNHGIIISVSVEDIDECETRLVMCDIHAECINEFGSYSCRCRHGYSLGLGGAVCLAPKVQDCNWTSFPTLLYVVCVLLAFLIAVLLVVLGVLHYRYHRGAFLPHCTSSTKSFSATNNNNSEGDVNNAAGTSSLRPPPPPPPLRLSSQASTTLDLPLLKFTPLTPPEGLQGKLQKHTVLARTVGGGRCYPGQGAVRPAIPRSECAAGWTRRPRDTPALPASPAVHTAPTELTCGGFPVQHSEGIAGVTAVLWSLCCDGISG
ncbi:hypothetical protein AOLI_G00236630 [Acnodon oligacanthus]